MTLSSATRLRLTTLLERQDEIKNVVMTRSAQRRAATLELLVRRRDALVAQAFARHAGRLPTSSLIDELERVVTHYARDSDWALYDSMLFASCLPEPPDAVSALLAPRALLFLSIRMLDDSLDGHENYKGHYPTVLAALPHAEAAKLNTIAASLLSMEASRSLGATDFDRAQQTLLGQAFEFSECAAESLPSYTAMAEAKMVSYGLLLYGPLIDRVPGACRAAAERFVRNSLFLGQIVNDLVDRAEDARSGQPNRWLLVQQCEHSDDPESEFCSALERLARECPYLGPVEAYGHARVADLARYALGNGADCGSR